MPICFTYMYVYIVYCIYVIIYFAKNDKILKK